METRWLGPHDDWPDHSRAESALRRMRHDGWWLKKGSGGSSKNFGKVFCHRPDGPNDDVCSETVYSTSHGTEEILEDLRRKCPHRDRDAEAEADASDPVVDESEPQPKWVREELARVRDRVDNLERGLERLKQVEAGLDSPNPDFQVLEELEETARAWLEGQPLGPWRPGLEDIEAQIAADRIKIDELLDQWPEHDD